MEVIPGVGQACSLDCDILHHILHQYYAVDLSLSLLSTDPFAFQGYVTTIMCYQCIC